MIGLDMEVTRESILWSGAEETVTLIKIDTNSALNSNHFIAIDTAVEFSHASACKREMIMMLVQMLVAGLVLQ